MKKTDGPENKYYPAIWRFHFYAGLIVAPFFLIAALSGVVMALKTPIEALAYGDRLYVAVQDEPLTPDAQLLSIMAAYPHAIIQTYIPPKRPNRSAQFHLKVDDAHHGGGHSDGNGLTVFVDPYTSDVLGSLNPSRTLYAYAKTLHGTLFMGAVGDHLIEVAAGFGVLMIVTGLFLWTSKNGRTSAGSKQKAMMTRSSWRELHSTVGVSVSLLMLFFLISGLAWTPVWGGKLVQAWSSFPAARSTAPASTLTHEALNHGDHKTVPWALEQTPMPMANAHAGHETTFNLDDVVALAKVKGFTGFRVNFPRPENGAWTVMAATISGDIADPRRDRTIHLDAMTGAVIADVGFADYSLMGKAMAAGVPLHQGDLGAWNIVMNVAFCFAIIAMIVSGIIMWWLRRPRRGFRLAPPPANRGVLNQGALVLFAASLLFPLTAFALAFVIGADFLAFSNRKNPVA